MFQLKPLHRDAIGPALERAEQYRLLNEPQLAESICLDVLEIDPGNQEALIALLLARTDQFRTEAGARIDETRALASGLEDEYRRLYYSGLICERWAKALVSRNQPGSGPVAYDWFRQAMDWYEQAERIRPAGHDDPILRWNTCARLIARNPHVRPEHRDDFLPLLE